MGHLHRGRVRIAVDRDTSPRDAALRSPPLSRARPTRGARAWSPKTCAASRCEPWDLSYINEHESAPVNSRRAPGFGERRARGWDSLVAPPAGAAHAPSPHDFARESGRRSRPRARRRKGAGHPVEYGDFECHYCGRAYPVVKELGRRFGDGLRVVFRHTPRLNTHPHAQHAAEAAEAAAAQGKFWEMHDRLFEHQDALGDADLSAHAAAIGLDTGRFENELRTHAHAHRVHDQEATGAHSVLATPTFFINGVRFDETRNCRRSRRRSGARRPQRAGDAGEARHPPIAGDAREIGEQPGARSVTLDS